MNKEFKKISKRILKNKNYKLMKMFYAHQNQTCYDHCFNVALKSYSFCKRFNINCNMEDLIKGALLHDYYLYDWHDKYSHSRLHGFRHNKIALNNAKRDFVISDKVCNIINSHMFPLTIWTIPKTKEALIVCLVDKIEATKEFSTVFRKVSLNSIFNYATIALAFRIVLVASNLL